MKRVLVLIFLSLSSCGETGPFQQRYEDAAESSSDLVESVGDYMVWINTPGNSGGEDLVTRAEDGEGEIHSYDFNEKAIERADKRIKKMKDRHAKAFTYMDIYRGEDSKAANLVAEFVEAIGPWIVGQEEKWDAVRICYDKSDPGEKRVRFSCLGYTAHINEETWKDLDAKILELADEVGGAPLNSYA